MNTPQKGILLDPPSHARYLSFSIADGAQLAQGLAILRDLVDGENTVAGIGQSVVPRGVLASRG